MKIISKQKLLIIILAVALTTIFVWFVIIDNYIIPTIQQEIINSYQNGYNAGIENSITELFQQTSDCQPTYIWVANDTKQLIDVACLQPIISDSSEITNP